MKVLELLKAYLKMIAAVFGVLILGFIAFAIWEGAIEPRLRSGSVCLTNDGCLFPMLNGRLSVRVLGFSADGSTILTRGSGDTLIHNADNGEKVTELDPDFESSFHTIIAGDGSLIATLNTRENGVEFFTPDGEYVDGWVWPEERDIQDFAFLPLVDGFALSGQDGVTMWRMEDGKQFTTLPDSDGAGLMVTSADGSTLATYDKEEDAIYVWPLERIADGIKLHEAGLHDAFVRDDALLLSGDGLRVAAYSAERAAVWDTRDGSLIFSTSLASEEIDMVALALSADGRRLAIGYDDGAVEAWSIDDDQPLALFEHGQAINGIALSPDGTKLAVGQSRDSRVTVITASERFASQSRARRGVSGAGAAQYLTPGKVYIDPIPGFALVWEVTP